MKRISSIFIFTVMMIVGLINVSYAAVSVSSDNRYFDFATQSFVLEGHVLVETDTRTIGADKARVNLMSKEVWADGNIYLREPESKINFSGANLYASDETKTAVIKGDVTFETPDITIKAERCSFNWDTKIAEFSGLVEVTRDKKVETYNVLHYNAVENKIIDAE